MMSKRYSKKLFQWSWLLAITALLSSCEKLIVLNSKGPVGQKEAQLIITAFVLMLIVVIPVFVMTFWFALRYRATNKKATYRPEWSDSKKVEWVIWMIPVAIIVVLSYLTWTKTYELDPYKPIKSEVKPLNVDVISTNWNWLFIYPDDSVASINELVIQSGRPISFRLTSASVMTSFFIPQLGSQMYAMAGMQTRLNLLSDHPGVYEGFNMEYSGEGYNEMQHFKVQAKTPEEFNEWMKTAKQSSEKLSMDKYLEISKPSVNYPVTVYSSAMPDLFDKVMAPYMDWMNHGTKKGCCHKSESNQMESDCCHKDKQKTSSCHDMDSTKTNN